jgi:hypothetical protein
MGSDGGRYRFVVLFGAGASYGSPGVLPVGPPLGRDLYAVLAKAFPRSWGAGCSELREHFEHHFETGMGVLWGKYPQAGSAMIGGYPSPHLLMQDMARLFLSYHLAPGKCDVYSQFLIKLYNGSKFEETCLSTLNYEHLLEEGMVQLGFGPRVLRPHGGCQFWIKTGGRLWVGKGRALGQGMNAVSRRIRVLSSNRVNRLLSKQNQGQYPCMAIYVEGKVTQMGQHYLWRVQERFRQRVLACDTVVLIGVQPWPADTHVWTGIFHTKARILYVGSTSGFEELQRRRGSSTVNLFLGRKFESVLEDVVENM